MRLCDVAAQPISRGARLCSSVDEMRGRTPGVMRERVEAADRLDARKRLVGIRRSRANRTENLGAVNRLQLAKRFRAEFQLQNRVSDDCLMSHRLLSGLRECADLR
jgi:hypothetical protein